MDDVLLLRASEVLGDRAGVVVHRLCTRAELWAAILALEEDAFNAGVAAETDRGAAWDKMIAARTLVADLLSVGPD